MGGITTIINKVKYIGIASLTIAILSILVLNIISSYSSSNIESNAEPVGNTSALANIDPAGISISISSYPSSSSTGGNNPNLSLSIPQGGGIATGRHTVSLGVGSDISWYQVMLSSQTEETSLIDKDDSSNKATIPPINDDILDSYYGIYGINGLERILSDTPQDSAWAYSVGPWSYDNSASTIDGYIHNLPPSSRPDVIYGGQGIDKTGAQNVDVYYGAKVTNLSTTPAGNYAAEIVYSATAKLQEPILTSVTPNTYELGSGADNTITITGKYLSTASKVYLSNESTGEIYYCTNVQLRSSNANGNTTLTCNIPTDQTRPAITEAGTYGVFVLTDAGETAYTDAATFTYTEQRLPAVTIDRVSPDSVQTPASYDRVEIYGSNLSDVNAIYVDLDGDKQHDGSDEECSDIRITSSMQVSCILPFYSTPGVYGMGLTTSSGASAYLDDAIAYTAQTRVVVNAVEPTSVCVSDNGHSKDFSFTGSNLDLVAKITLITRGSGQDIVNLCTISSKSQSTIVCQVQSLDVGPYASVMVSQYFDAWFYDASGNFLVRKGSGFIEINGGC